MTFDLDDVLASKRRHRYQLAALPIAEKLRLLDALRERTLTIRRTGVAVRRQGKPGANVRAPGGVPRRDTTG